jgi:hypothetical protein
MAAGPALSRQPDVGQALHTGLAALIHARDGGDAAPPEAAVLDGAIGEARAALAAFRDHGAG